MTEALDPVQYETARQLLEAILGYDAPGWISVFTIDEHGGRHVSWCEDAGEALDIGLAAVGHDVWFGVGRRREPLDHNRRGGDADVVSISALWVDIDIAGPGHKTKKTLPANETEVGAFLADLPWRPSAIIATGGGYQAYWILDEPITPDDGMADLLTRWGAYLVERAAQRGWHLDNVFDPSRVLRLPLTMNRKLVADGGPERPVYVLQTTGLTYSWLDIAEQIPEAPERPQELPTAVPYIGPARPGDHFRAATQPGRVLERAGWTLVRTDHNGDQQWRHPEATNESSATVYAADGRCCIWTDSTRLRQRGSYDSFGLYVELFHAGDASAAASQLRAAGYGARAVTGDLATLIPGPGSGTVAPLFDPPIPWPAEPEPVPFPVDIFPAYIADFVEEVADRVQVPVDLPAQMALGALAAMVQGRAEIMLTGTWREPLNLWLATVMPSGSGKTPGGKPMAAVVDRLEDELIELAQETAKQAKNDARILEKKLEAAVKAAAKDPDLETAVHTIQAELDALDVKAQHLPRLLVSDATPEKMMRVLETADETLANLSTEAPIFDHAVGKYAESPVITNLLHCWDGEKVIIDRSGGSSGGGFSLRLQHPLITFSVCTQPDVIDELRRSKELVGRGYVARWMVAFPPDRRGSRDRRSQALAAAYVHQQAYTDRMLAIGRRYAALETPGTIWVDPAAVDLFLDWSQALEENMGPEKALRPIVEWANKIIGSTLRAAGLLFLADGLAPSPGNMLDVETMTRAIRLGEFWLASAQRIAGVTSSDPVDVEAKRIWDWIADEYDRDAATVSSRDIHKAFFRRGYRYVETLKDPLNRLCDMGYLRAAFDDELRLGRKGKQWIFYVNRNISPDSVENGRVVAGSRGVVAEDAPSVTCDDGAGVAGVAGVAYRGFKSLSLSIPTSLHTPLSTPLYATTATTDVADPISPGQAEEKNARNPRDTPRHPATTDLAPVNPTPYKGLI
ncbi:MAG: DUF3987 domain-containing protein [Ilumatobacteraceae bacterium]